MILYLDMSAARQISCASASDRLAAQPPLPAGGAEESAIAFGRFEVAIDVSGPPGAELGGDEMVLSMTALWSSHPC